jgi:hypothetical protein
LKLQWAVRCISSEGSLRSGRVVLAPHPRVMTSGLAQGAREPAWEAIKEAADLNPESPNLRTPMRESLRADHMTHKDLEDNKNVVSSPGSSGFSDLWGDRYRMRVWWLFQCAVCASSMVSPALYKPRGILGAGRRIYRACVGQVVSHAAPRATVAPSI